jgi:multicomponent Na+:H+ antiporter subunit G
MTEILLYIAAIFMLLGSIGLLRFPDIYARTHAVALLTVGGVCLAMLTLAIKTWFSIYSVKALLVILVILLTSPTATHAIAKAAYDSGIKPKLIIRDDLKER